MHGQMKINGFGGARIVDVAVRLGDVAVTRSFDDVGCRITHIRTEFSVPYVFASSPAAEVAAVEIGELVDWPGFVKSLANGKKPNSISAIKAICRKYGGKPIGVEVTPAHIAELRRRVDTP